MVASGRQHRRHRSRAEADQLVIEYEASGVTQAEFCRQKELPLKTLARYLTRYRKQTARGNQPQQSQRLVAVEVAGAGNSGSELAVVLHGGLRIEVKRGFDATTLRQLVVALEV
jgi:NADH dehydrogenase FAD-containing subunit